MRTESPAYLRSVYKAFWRGPDDRDEEAEVYAQCFVRANLLGKDTQGIACDPGVGNVKAFLCGTRTGITSSESLARRASIWTG